MDVDTFLHVDDGLLLGPSWTVHWLIEHVTRQNHDMEYGKTSKAEGSVRLGSTARGDTAEANPKYIRDVVAVLGLEDFNSFATQSVKRTPC